jgi:hypothetical protein
MYGGYSIQNQMLPHFTGNALAVDLLSRQTLWILTEPCSHEIHCTNRLGHAIHDYQF